MKIKPNAIAIFFAILPAAFAANPQDLYTRVVPPTDPSPGTLIANGTIVWGDQFSNNTVLGSQIVVNDALLETETGVPGPVSSLSGVHIPTNSRRTDYADITRWYQKDGNVQIFRLFQGENNYRYDIPAEAPPSRVEAVSPTLSVAPGTWRVWEGTYTIVDPLGGNIFQLFHSGSDLWSFHLDMNSAGDIYFIRRSSIAGLPDRITIAENLVGKSLAIRVRANGYNYEVYKKIPFVDANWVLVTIGQYQQSPTDQVIFRWGIYPGSQPGTTSSDGLLFVSGAATSVSSTPPVLPPATYYWDNSGATSGFGAAAGTWAAPTTGSASQGWSTDGTGATAPANVTTTTFDTVNFGNGATGLAAGNITVSGAVICGNMNIASGTGDITFNGGSISMPAETIITLVGSAGRTINSVIGGASDGFTVAGTGTLVLNGLNTFNGPVVIGNNVNDTTVRINSIADYGVGAPASSLGAPSSMARGLIQIGSGSRSSTLEFTNAAAASSTNRQVQIGSVANGSGSATVLNNDADAADSLTFSNTAFNVAAIGPYSSTNRSITLGGSNTGNNTIAGAIIDNGSSKVGLNKSGTGTWMLSGVSSYSGSTNVNAGTLKSGANNVLPAGAGKGNVSVNGGANTSSRGTLDLNGFNLAINGLSGTANTSLGCILNNATGTNKTLTVGNNNTSATFNGIISNNSSGTGTVALTKVGTGTQTLAGPNTYTGATVVSAGTLALGANNVLADATALVIGNSTLNAATFDDTVGTLDVTGAATINLGTGANLAFANSSAVDWAGGTLNLTGTFVSGSSIRFGTTSGGLIPAQLALISAPGFGPLSLNASGYLTATVSNLPILIGSNIVDDKSGGPVGVGGFVTYTLTFSKDMDAATVDASDFGNAGNATITIGTITETSPGVFTVQVTPTSGATLQFRVNAGAVLTDSLGNALDTTSAIVDDTTLLVDNTPPTLTGSDIVDDKNGGPLGIGSLVTYTLTFSEEINAATVDAADFGNAGSAGVTIGTITEIASGVFTVEVTPTSTGTLIFQINEGAVLTDVFGNALDTSPAIADNTTLAVLGLDAYWDIDATTPGAGGATPAGTWSAANTFWNNAADGTGATNVWVPGQTAIFAAGTNATGTYSVTVDGIQEIGGLTVEDGSVTLTGGTELRLTKNATADVAAGSSATVATSITEDASPRSLSKNGAGTLILGQINTYSGTTTINHGTLLVDTEGTLGDSGKALTIGSGVAGTQSVNSVGNLTLNASAQLAGITLKSNTSNTTSPGNIGILSIASDRTLTASGITVGITAVSQDTNTALSTGAAGTGGTLTVNGNVSVGQSAGNGSVKTTTDVNLSGLQNFNATSTGGSLTVGSNANARATLVLANNTNTINVGTLSVGNTNNNYNVADLSTISLGAGTNALQATNIILGQGKGNGQMIFAGANGSVTISGLNGLGTSNITIGNHTTATYAGGGTSTLALAGHDASVSAGTVILGQKSGTAASGALPTSLTFDTGTFTASTIQMAVASAGSNNITSTFTVGGATANSTATGTVTIAGNLLLAAATGGTATPASTLTINGGTVNVNNTTPTPGEGIFDTSTAGASTTTLTLAGGTLNLNGGTVGGIIGTGKRNITNLNFQSGTLKNVFQINDGAGLTKTTAGTLVLSGANSYTGITTINAGTLALGATNTLPASTSVSIAAATLDAATFSNTTSGTLDVTSTAVINLGAGAALAFANSSAVDWTGGTLNITGTFVSGSSLRFGTTSSGLTDDQLLKITAPGFTAFDLDANGYLTATAGSSYSIWQSANGTTQASNLDHDNDGVSNGIEYFLGGSSNTTGQTPLPGITNNLGTLSVTWTKAAAYIGTYGTHFWIETSPTLTGQWTLETVGENVTINGNNVTYIFPSGPSLRFARLKVAGP